MISTSSRASPLPPDERRAALIASTLSLVLAHGPDVNTRQIAQAAGVAEGTIFRVFATKDELVSAAISSAFDPSTLLHDLRAIDRTAPLRARLVSTVEILQHRTARVFRLMDALGASEVPGEGRDCRSPSGRAAAEHDRGWRPRPDQSAEEIERNRRIRSEQAAVIQQAITDLIEPDRDRLRCAPPEAARRLHLLTVAGSHPRLVEGDPMPPEEIVSTLLDGIRLRPEHDTRDPVPSPQDASLPEAPDPRTSCQDASPEAPDPRAPHRGTSP